MTKRDEINVKFGRNLKAMRLANGIYQKDLAKMIGVSTLQLHCIENGRTNATVKTLWKIQQIINLDYEKLFDLNY